MAQTTSAPPTELEIGDQYIYTAVDQHPGCPGKGHFLGFPAVVLAKEDGSAGITSGWVVSVDMFRGRVLKRGVFLTETCDGPEQLVRREAWFTYARQRAAESAAKQKPSFFGATA